MVLGVDPEHRHDLRLLLARGGAGELDGGDGLQQGEQGAAEGSRLLAGQDSNRVRVGDLAGSLARRGRRAAALLLG